MLLFQIFLTDYVSLILKIFNFSLYFKKGELPSTEKNVRGESFEKGSRCVVGNIIEVGYVIPRDSGRCLKYTCVDNGRELRFHLKGGEDIVCTKPGTRAEAPQSFKGSIVCPDPQLYCKFFLLLTFS